MFRLDSKIEFHDKENDVLAIGELLIDMISTNYEDSHTYQRFFGGSPSNIAMNAKKLGIRTRVASAIGEDDLGTFLLKHLDQAQIDTRYIQRVDESTSMVVLSKSKSTPIPIFYRAADYHLDYTVELKDSILESKIIHFSSWPLSRMPARKTMEQVIEDAKKHQTLICFDPNYHPAVWKVKENAVEYVKSIIQRVDIVKPSEDDAERLFGKDTPYNQINKFLQLGVKLVIMTLGKDGAIVSNGMETARFDTLATKVVDTTGAGDSFWSGFYTAVVQGYTIREALQLGFAVSAYKLQFMGAVIDLPTLDIIRDLYEL